MRTRTWTLLVLLILASPAFLSMEPGGREHPDDGAVVEDPSPSIDPVAERPAHLDKEDAVGSEMEMRGQGTGTEGPGTGTEGPGTGTEGPGTGTEGPGTKRGWATSEGTRSGGALPAPRTVSFEFNASGGTGLYNSSFSMEDVGAGERLRVHMRLNLDTMAFTNSSRLFFYINTGRFDINSRMTDDLGRFLWSYPQLDGINGSVNVDSSTSDLGFTTGIASAGSLATCVKGFHPKLRLTEVSITLSHGEVPKGGWIEVTYGASVNGTKAPVVTYPTYLPMFLKSSGVPPQFIAGSPGFNVRPASPAVFITTIPADVGAGEPFDMKLCAVDQHGNPVEDLTGNVTLEATMNTTELAHVEGLPPRVSLEPEDGGSKTIEGLVCNQTGFMRIGAWLEEGGRAVMGRSNPCRVSPEAPGHRRYFGDLQFHTSLGGHGASIAMPADAYTYARDVALLDFAALTEHSAALTEDDWGDLQGITDGFYVPGDFTTLFAYEWNGGNVPRTEEHIVCYFREPGAPLYDPVTPVNRTSRLWKELAGTGLEFMTIPHPMNARAGDRFTAYNSTYMPVYEITSNKGVFDNRTPYDAPDFLAGDSGPFSAQDNLMKGRRFGFIAGSDNHFGHPGMNDITSEVPSPSGLTACIAKDNDRNGIWNSMMKKRTYATTGPRMYLDLDLDGNVMGEEFFSRDDVTLNVTVAGTMDIDVVEVYRNNELVKSFDGDGEQGVFSWTDTEPASMTRVTFYYVRVIQLDGEMAWSSPLWRVPVGRTPSAPQLPEALTGEGFIMVQWDGPGSTGHSPVTGYRVYRGTSPGFYPDPNVDSHIALVPAGNYSYMDEEAIPGVTYYYVIVAQSIVGMSGGSKEVAGVADEPPASEGGERKTVLPNIAMTVVLSGLVIMVTGLILESRPEGRGGGRKKVEEKSDEDEHGGEDEDGDDDDGEAGGGAVNQTKGKRSQAKRKG